MVQAERRYQRNPDFIHRKIVDESVLVPIHQNVADMNCIYTLNAVGATIWEQLESSASMDDLRTRLMDEYDADPDVLTADLQRFLGELSSIGAIREI